MEKVLELIQSMKDMNILIKMEKKNLNMKKVVKGPQVPFHP